MNGASDVRGPSYWRSLDELAATPEFREAVAREFPGETWEALPPATRRQFMKVMAASLALAGLTACRWPEEEILPFAERPPERVPGVPRHFATVFAVGGVGQGVLVTSHDGRPTKVEGNPRHPASLGAASAMAQAWVLELYDPDRSRHVVERARGERLHRDREALVAMLAETAREAAARRGEGLAVLAEATGSATVDRLRARLGEALPGARWYEWEPVSWDAEREGLRLAYGRALRLVPRLGGAEVVACLGADPVGGHPDAVRLAREVAAGRRAGDGRMNRIWCAEAGWTLTGAMADERLALRPSHLPALVAAVAAALGVIPEGAVPALPGPERAWAGRVAADLAAHRGAAALLVGPQLPAAAHALAAAVNEALGAVGRTVELIPDPDPDRPSHLEAVTELARRIEAGEVATLVIVGGNPVYDAPGDLGLAELVGGVPRTIRLGLYEDETSRRATWHVPRAHGLESWGDARAWDGTLAVRQPLIAPLHGGWTEAELLAVLLGEAGPRAHELVRETVAAMAGDEPPDAFWRRCLHDGVVPGSAPAPVRPALRRDAVARAAEELPPADDGGLELELVPDRKVHDGRFANNGWLQELPDPITTITWDNAAAMAPATAAALGVASDGVVRLETPAGAVELPVYVLPGMPEGVVTAALGYGREAAGRVGDGVGENLYRVRTAGAPWLVTAVTGRATGRRHRLAVTQDHHAIDRIGFEARQLRIGELVREVTLERYLEDPGAVRGHEEDLHLVSLWKEHRYEGEQWGMAIDLSACTGCTACVVACQAENNVPVVGRERVLEGREMHWIRIDRYFAGPPDGRVRVVHQPVACVQCENAPCEQVCPVAATQHTHDGLNAMVYNRCVGTRYCSNNCPYKVRRFNFFNYHKGLGALQAMQHNPEVTVRSRGVMEKCTYCVQRIEAARIAARREGRPIADGEIVPACAQTCPTEAIVFGDLNDPGSRISKLRESRRGYAMLAELNVRPRTHYLARLRNPAAGGTEGEAS